MAKKRNYVRGNIAERFHPKVLRGEADECWAWLGSYISSGYGSFSLPGKTRFHTVPAHRVAFMLANPGVDVTGLVVCHRCDNRACVNPSHLFLGTQRDNILDMFAKGRGNRCCGTNHPGARLTPDGVRGIRQAALTGLSYREIATAYDVSYVMVWKVAQRLSWKHVPD